MEGDGNNSCNQFNGALNFGGPDAAENLHMHQQNAPADMDLNGADLTEVGAGQQPQADLSEDGSGGSSSGTAEAGAPALGAVASSSRRSPSSLVNRAAGTGWNPPEIHVSLLARDALGTFTRSPSGDVRRDTDTFETNPAVEAAYRQYQEAMEHLFQVLPEVPPMFHDVDGDLSSPRSPDYSPPIPSSPTSNPIGGSLEIRISPMTIHPHDNAAPSGSGPITNNSFNLPATTQPQYHPSSSFPGEESADDEEDMLEDDLIDSEDGDGEDFIIADPITGAPLESSQVRQTYLPVVFAIQSPDYAAERARIISEVHDAIADAYRSGTMPTEEMLLVQEDENGNLRVDFDNMTYEQLLALQERIGIVSTGLSEEKISSYVTDHQFQFLNTGPPTEFVETCCICQEEYADGENLVKLDCKHEFHLDCIKLWLLQKNVCPICKRKAIRA